MGPEDITVDAPPGGPSTAWWLSFDHRTRAGLDPLLIKGAWGQGAPGPEEIDQVVHRMQSVSDERRRLRIYLDGERRDDLATRVMGTPLPPDQVVFASVQRFLGADRLAFILNDVQDWSPAFTRAVGAWLEGMVQVRGMPPGGMEQIVFAGNYAGTPFGAHRGYEHAWLFHLGPGSKAFHLWSASEFQQLTGSLDDVMDYEPLLAHGIGLVLEPGDALYLPAQWFHIGRQDTYSCSLAVGMYDQAIEHWVQSTIVDRLRASQPWHKMAYVQGSVEVDPLRASVEHELLPRLEAEVLEALDDHWFRLRSNAGFHHRRERWWPAPAPGAGDRVALHHPFEICWRRRDEHLDVYLCHHRSTLVWHPSWPLVFRALDQGATLSVGEIAEALADRWSIHDVLRVLEALAATGGLERIA